jgi:hypothetical protein
MSSKRIDGDKLVFKFTQPTLMKFQPIEDLEEPTLEAKPGIIARLKNFFSPPKDSPKSPLKRTNSLKSENNLKALRSKPKIKFVRRLTNEHVLVGNEDQIDAMGLSGIISDFVDTQFLWSLNVKQAIVQLAVDSKSTLRSI